MSERDRFIDLYNPHTSIYIRRQETKKIINQIIMKRILNKSSAWMLVILI